MSAEILVDVEINAEYIWEIPHRLKDINWQSDRALSSHKSKYRSYLNRLARYAVCQWLNVTDELGEDLDRVWEVVNGSAIAWGQRRLIVVPTETMDTDELRVSQEWIDIPEWIGDYYLGVQVNLERGWVKIWGYATHQQLKQEGKYCQRDRTYSISQDSLFTNTNVLLLTEEFNSAVLTRVPVPSIPALSWTQTAELLEIVGSDRNLFPNRSIAFQYWAALMTPNLLKLVYQRRLGLQIQPDRPATVNLSQWLQGRVSEGWQAIEELINPEFIPSFRQIEVRRGRLIDLVIDLQSEKIVLIVRVTETSATERNILAQIYPHKSQDCLPENLEMAILDEFGEVFEVVVTRDKERVIQYPFAGSPGETFYIKISWQEITFTQPFVV